MLPNLGDKVIEALLNAANKIAQEADGVGDNILDDGSCISEDSE